MAGVSFFADMSIVIAVAAVVALVFSRLNLPLTVGYILAGVIVGPNLTPALISDEQNIRMLSDLGVMFLMFSIGLGFSFRRVRQMGPRVLFPAVWDVVWMIGGGFLLARLLGWSMTEGFLLGLILCDSSTSIAAKTLEELGWIRKRFADTTFGIAVIEDVLAILLIAVLNGVTGADTGGAGVWDTAAVIAEQLLVLALFLVGAVVFGILLVPRLMNYVTEHFSDELVLMVALGFCFAVSCLAQEGLSLSLVVGAFLAGAVVAEANARNRIERVVKPIGNLFGAVFFVSVGLMMEPDVLWANAPVIVFLTAVMIVMKLVNNTVSCIIVGESPKDAFRVGIGMGQVAEFSFIIAGIAMAGGMTERPIYQIAVGIALLCTATNPYLLKASDRLYALCSRCCGPNGRLLLGGYRRWQASLASRRAGGSGTAAAVRGYLIHIAVALAIVAIFFVAVFVVSRIEVVGGLLRGLDAEWHRLSGVGGSPAGLLCTMAALLLSAAPLWAALHNWRGLARLVATGSVGGNDRRKRRVSGFVRTVLNLAGWVGAALYVSMLAMVFVANVWILLVLLVLLTGFLIRYTKRFRREYRISSTVLRQAFDADGEDGDEPPEEAISVDTMISVHTERFRVPSNAAACGKTLAELNLRRVTGASVVAAYSRSHRQTRISAGGDTVVHAGDILVLVGSGAELSAAMRILGEPVPEEP